MGEDAIGMEGRMERSTPEHLDYQDIGHDSVRHPFSLLVVPA
jgi:hypothetical protein